MKGYNADLRELTPEELAALQAYAAEHGRCWKEDLRDQWFNASAPGLLHSIRNTRTGRPGCITSRLPK